MTDAIRFVLAQHHFRAGAYSVGYQSCDDSIAATGNYDEGGCMANAQAYAADPEGDRRDRHVQLRPHAGRDRGSRRGSRRADSDDQLDLDVCRTHRVERAARRDEARHLRRRRRGVGPSCAHLHGDRTQGQADRGRRGLPRRQRGSEWACAGEEPPLGARQGCPHPHARRLYAHCALCPAGRPGGRRGHGQLPCGAARAAPRRRTAVRRPIREGDRQTGRGVLRRHSPGRSSPRGGDREIGREPGVGDVEGLQDQGHEWDPRQLLVRPQRGHDGGRGHDLPDCGR